MDRPRRLVRAHAISKAQGTAAAQWAGSGRPYGLTTPASPHPCAWTVDANGKRLADGTVDIVIICETHIADARIGESHRASQRPATLGRLYPCTYLQAIGPHQTLGPPAYMPTRLHAYTPTPLRWPHWQHRLHCHTASTAFSVPPRPTTTTGAGPAIMTRLPPATPANMPHLPPWPIAY